MELVEKRFNGEGEEAGWTLTIKRLVRTGAESFTAIWTKEVRYHCSHDCFSHRIHDHA